VNISTGPKSIKAYPNPVSADLHVSVGGLEPSMLLFYQVVDIRGVVVMMGEGLTDLEGGYQTTLQTAGKLQSGVYILSVRTHDATMQFTLVKK
jgi:hypothetical protein